MQINPQVNTSIIRSVTLRHCPTGMCEFHLEGSQMGDNSSNQVPSESAPPPQLKDVHAFKCGGTVCTAMMTSLAVIIKISVSCKRKIKVAATGKTFV